MLRSSLDHCVSLHIRCAFLRFFVNEIFQHVCYISTTIITLVSSTTAILYEYCVLEIDTVI